VLGVSASNCSLSVGGSDVYIKPGDTLKVVSSAVGLTAGGLSISTGQLAGFSSALTTLPGTASAHTYALTTTNPVSIVNLAAGTYKFNWSVKGLTLLGITIPLSLTSKALSAGAALNYAGTIHVTNSAPKCGVSVQVPGPSVSLSVTGLPPITVGVPPINVTVPVTVPTPNTAPSTSGGPKAGGGPGLNYTPPPPTVPEEVVPKGHGGVYLGSGQGFFGGALPDVAAPAPAALPAVAKTAHKSTAATAKANAVAVKKAAKTVELAANKTPSAQVPVVLAIIAVFALIVVTGTYARLYLLRRS
jgi:hypothetical protein